MCKIKKHDFMDKFIILVRKIITSNEEDIQNKLMLEKKLPFSEFNSEHRSKLFDLINHHLYDEEQIRVSIWIKH